MPFEKRGIKAVEFAGNCNKGAHIVRIRAFREMALQRSLVESRTLSELVERLDEQVQG